MYYSENSDEWSENVDTTRRRYAPMSLNLLSVVVSACVKSGNEIVFQLLVTAGRSEEYESQWRSRMDPVGGLITPGCGDTRA